MNILITISVRWWNANAYYAVSVAEALMELGHNVYVAGDPDYPPTLEAMKSGLPTLPIRFSSLNPFIFVRDMVKLYRFLKNRQIEIINAHRPEDHLWTVLLSRILKIPLVRTVGDVRSPHNNFLNRWLHIKPKVFFIFSSDSSKIRYNSVWPAFNPDFSIIPGGVSSKLFHPAPKNPQLLKQFHIPEEHYVVGIVARLSPIKDHVTFITASALIVDKIKNVIFIISGSEEEVFVKDLKALANSLNVLDHFRFIDRFNPVGDLISIFDIGVIASKGSEVIARIAMEYIASGIPVVATDVNVLPEVIVHDRNGIIIGPDSAYEMAEAVVKLLGDVDLRSQISKNNQEDFAHKFDILMVAKSICSIYKDVTKKNNMNVRSNAHR
ncbi:MAG: glycosyltransferase family 1 protein [Calditrichales bacterium]|nr:MAG: glycosyltransferase family 1 protein [Calditrichales bacterium]